MGLFTYNKHGIQVASRELGKRAATLFADAIGANVAKLPKKKIADASVSDRDLERLSAIAPSEIEEARAERELDRKSVIEGKDSYVRVDLGGRRNIKNKQK